MASRILIFSTSYFPLVGGAEIAVKEITDRLPEIEFDLITAKQKPDLASVEKIGNVTVYRLGFGHILLDKLLIPYLGAMKTLKLQRNRKYDAYWCIMVTFASGAAYIANWFQKRIPIILTLQEGDSDDWLRHRWMGLIDLSWRLALARTHILTAISTYLQKRAKRLGYKNRSELIPNGVDVEKFQNVQSHPRDRGKTVLITTSRLVEKNAVGDIIEALKFLPESVGLKILGDGPLEPELKLQAKSSRLEARIEFLGHVPYEEIPKHLHQADIFVRPSLSEGFGNSFIEAMAAGLPVIASPVGGITDFLVDGETGLMVEPKSPRLIAFQVQKLINDSVLRDQITINAKRMVEAKYDWNLVAEEMKKKVFNTV
ncbi:MAG: glycosyltransferase family 4 protein [Parcubacteria group bacterium]